MSTPQTGNQHDTFDLEWVFAESCKLLEAAELRLEALFLNADKAFDVISLRQACVRHGIEAMWVRWQVEEFHRSFKQLTGAEKCQCRRAQAQRNHLACCYLAWVSLRQFARQSAQALYQAHHQQWAPYLRQLLAKPLIPALLPASA